MRKSQKIITMTTKTTQPDILVVQFRTDVSEAHEQECLLEELPFAANRFRFVSAVDMQYPETLAGINGVLLGGSGEFLMSNGDGEGSWREPAFAFIQQVLDADIPLLGICFGYQMLCMQQGASIVQDPQMKETGTYNTHRQETSKDDPLFNGIPDMFRGQYGHKDTIVDLPDHLIPLSRTNKVAVNAVRVSEKSAWGLLFHPELNKSRMRTRLSMFPHYIKEGQSVEEVLSQFEDTPEASKALHNFFNIIDEKIGS